jgi:hypothetical protein
MQTVSNPNALALLCAYEILIEAGRRARRQPVETADGLACTRCGGPVYVEGDAARCWHCDEPYGVGQ